MTTIQAVVITGNGPTFCAGADLKTASTAGNAAARWPPSEGDFAGIVRRSYPKPIIAAVNGPAFAGGFEIVLACDLVVAAEDAAFGIPEVKRGLFAAAGGLIRLPKRDPAPLAMELAITGDPISAERARELGLVSRVVPLAESWTPRSSSPHGSRPTVRSRCGRHSDGARSRRPHGGRGVAAQLRARDGGLPSKDSIEGATAFAEKREPRWTGT